MISEPAWYYYLILALSALIQLVGLVGTALIFFPGPTVAWLGQLFWAIAVGFNAGHAGWQFGLTIALFAINTVLMLAGSLIDNIMMAGKAREKGSPWWEIGLSWLAMIVGGLLLTPLGGLAAALLTIFVVEYFRLGKEAGQAWEASKSVAFGWGWSTLIRVGIVVLMIGLWVVMITWL